MTVSYFIKKRFEGEWKVSYFRCFPDGQGSLNCSLCPGSTWRGGNWAGRGVARRKADARKVEGRGVERRTPPEVRGGYWDLVRERRHIGLREVQLQQLAVYVEPGLPKRSHRRVNLTLLQCEEKQDTSSQPGCTQRCPTVRSYTAIHMAPTHLASPQQLESYCN